LNARGNYVARFWPLAGSFLFVPCFGDGGGCRNPSLGHHSNFTSILVREASLRLALCGSLRLRVVSTGAGEGGWPLWRSRPVDRGDRGGEWDSCALSFPLVTTSLNLSFPSGPVALVLQHFL
jgi:hypothetical protein